MKEKKNRMQLYFSLSLSLFLPTKTTRADKQSGTNVELNIANMVVNKNFYCAVASCVTVAHFVCVKSRLVMP